MLSLRARRGITIGLHWLDPSESTLKTQGENLIRVIRSRRGLHDGWHGALSESDPFALPWDGCSHSKTATAQPCQVVDL
jgi:hypothetical protein